MCFLHTTQTYDDDDDDDEGDDDFREKKERGQLTTGRPCFLSYVKGRALNVWPKKRPQQNKLTNQGAVILISASEILTSVYERSIFIPTRGAIERR